MGWHARDPSGVRHVETVKQAREASTIKTTLETIFDRCEVQYRRMGDDEFQRRIRIDDVIMSKWCRAAYVHVSAVGDKLEARQAFVWLVRNKGAVKTALAKRFRRRGRLPHIHFVESKLDKWFQHMERARRQPELELPNPLAGVVADLDRRKDKWKKWGVGDANAPFSPWGYGDPGS